jgi:hypothetical protein
MQLTRIDATVAQRASFGPHLPDDADLRWLRGGPTMAGRVCVKTRSQILAVRTINLPVHSQRACVICIRHRTQDKPRRVGIIIAGLTQFGLFTRQYWDTARFARLILM